MNKCKICQKKIHKTEIYGDCYYCEHCHKDYNFPKYETDDENDENYSNQEYRKLLIQTLFERFKLTHKS